MQASTSLPDYQLLIKPPTNQPLLTDNLPTILNHINPARPYRAHLIASIMAILKHHSNLPRPPLDTTNHPIIAIHPNPGPIRPPYNLRGGIRRLRCKGIRLDEYGRVFLILERQGRKRLRGLRGAWLGAVAIRVIRALRLRREQKTHEEDLHVRCS